MTAQIQLDPNLMPALALASVSALVSVSVSALDLPEAEPGQRSALR